MDGRGWIRLPFSPLPLPFGTYDLLFEDETSNTFKLRFSSSISPLLISHYTHTYIANFFPPPYKGSITALFGLFSRHNERHMIATVLFHLPNNSPLSKVR